MLFLALRIKLNLWHFILCYFPFSENIAGFESITKGRDVISCLALTHETCRVLQYYQGLCKQYKAVTEERIDDTRFRGVCIGGCGMFLL